MEAFPDVRKTHIFPPPLRLKTIILPRQARDEHIGKHSKKRLHFSRTGLSRGIYAHGPTYPADFSIGAKIAHLSSHFILKMIIFAKTGSGQPQGKHSKRDAFFAGPDREERAGADVSAQLAHGGVPLRGDQDRCGEDMLFFVPSLSSNPMGSHFT